jgi:hypothetical protein
MRDEVPSISHRILNQPESAPEEYQRADTV